MDSTFELAYFRSGLVPEALFLRKSVSAGLSLILVAHVLNQFVGVGKHRIQESRRV